MLNVKIRFVICAVPQRVDDCPCLSSIPQEELDRVNQCVNPSDKALLLASRWMVYGLINSAIPGCHGGDDSVALIRRRQDCQQNIKPVILVVAGQTGTASLLYSHNITHDGNICAMGFVENVSTPSVPSCSYIAFLSRMGMCLLAST